LAEYHVLLMQAAFGRAHPLHDPAIPSVPKILDFPWPFSTTAAAVGWSPRRRPCFSCPQRRWVRAHRSLARPQVLHRRFGLEV
jgi:hypothetical protein